MKRSEAVKKLLPHVIGKTTIMQQAHSGIYQSSAERLMNFLEQELGMKPPPIPVKLVRPKDYGWGSMCTMRCNCQDCNPEFLVNEWEKE